MYTEGVPEARAVLGARGAGEKPPNPCVTGCLTKGVSKMQPMFSALAAVSTLGLKATSPQILAWTVQCVI